MYIKYQALTESCDEILENSVITSPTITLQAGIGLQFQHLDDYESMGARCKRVWQSGIWMVCFPSGNWGGHGMTGRSL